MSTEPLKVGDVCIVVDNCCARTRAHYIGRECTIVRRPSTARELLITCCYCGHGSSADTWVLDFPEAPKDVRGTHCMPASFLRKRPEQSDQRDALRTDFTPATPEFVADLLQQLRSKEPA